MWLATKFAAGQRIAPMRHRQDQLGFDGAVHYRELHEAHPEVERGPDEDIEHHYGRLKAAERIAPRLVAEAARAKMPSEALLVDQLGTREDARRYRRLVRDYPEVERGPDQEIADHYHALKRAFEKENAEVGENQAVGTLPRGLTVDAPRPDVKPRSKPRAIKLVRPPEEIEAEQQAPATPSDLGGMPQRIPGWFTGDAMDSAPPGYGVPPMSRRTPGAKLRGPTSPNVAPLRQTRDEWLKGLADKGIYLNGDGTRMTPEEMALPSRPGPPAPRGHDIWSDLIDRPAAPGRHRAAHVVTAYITNVLGAQDDPVARFWRRHNVMFGDGWTHHESGSGNWYEKNIGGKTHRIMSDNDGWTHHADGEIPKLYPDLKDALLHANRGQTQADFVGIRSTVEDSSHQPDRAQPTRAIKRLAPPKSKGKFQTLNSTWSEQA